MGRRGEGGRGENDFSILRNRKKKKKKISCGVFSGD